MSGYLAPASLPDRAVLYEKIPIQHKRLAEFREKWKRENPERHRENQRAALARRRSREAGNGGSFSVRELRQLRSKQRDRCAGCGIKSAKLEIDHIIPTARGGTGNISNIQLLCLSCNRSKAASDPIEWAQQNGRLL